MVGLWDAKVPGPQVLASRAAVARAVKVTDANATSEDIAESLFTLLNKAGDVAAEIKTLIKLDAEGNRGGDERVKRWQEFLETVLDALKAAAAILSR